MYRLHKCMQRVLAFLLAAVMALSGMDVSGVAQVFAEESATYSTYLDGWKVQVAWSTASLDYTWDATTDSSKQPKLVVTYRLENAERDYEAGDIVFQIPGIGSANRASIIYASDNPADDVDSEWDCVWDQENDIYTFTNNFTVSTGQSTSGGFELMWTLDARSTENGYTQTKSPVFTLYESGSEAGSITLEPLTFTFTSVRDRYRISMSADKLSASDWEASDQDYVWYEIETRFDKDWLARGLYRSSYYIVVELPDGADYSAVIIEDSSGNQFSLEEITDENGDTVYGFYPFENRSGNIGTKYSTYYNTFSIGFLKDAFLDGTGNYTSVTVKGHLNRLYYDETEWVTTAGTNEKVDDQVSFTIEDYGFTWSGYIYTHSKWNTSYEYYPYNHNAPSTYSKRLNAVNIYNGKVIPFILHGVANRNYSTSYSLKSSRSLGANTTGVSQVGVDGNSDTYSLVMGDDKLAVYLTDGSVRNLTNDEYDITYITVPADSYGYDWEVYVAYDDQDTLFEDYELFASGNTSTAKTVQFGDHVKAMYIRVNDIDGSYSYDVTVGVKLHLDWDSEQAKAEAGEATVDSEGHLVDFSYLMSIYEDANGDEVNDCALTEDSYSGSYGTYFLGRDEAVYGQYLMRAYSNVWLRTPITNLSTTTSVGAFTAAGTADAGFTSTAVSKGTIVADDEGSLTSFSLYIVIPDGLEFDFTNTDITLSGSGTFENGDSATSSDFADHVTYSVGEYNGKTMLIADFDFSDNPLEASETTTVSISYGLTLSYMDFLTYGNYYSVSTYLLAHDDGLDQIAGTAIMSDQYDIDGNGVKSEKMAYSSDSETVSDSASAWREYVSKYVKSYYDSNYVTDTVTRLYNNQESSDVQAKSLYSYRLEFGLGSDNAKNIDFFDRIEQGASIAENEWEPNVYTDYSSAWQGTFQSVDTTYAVKMGLIPTVYYSTDPDQVFDVDDPGWTDQVPADLSTVKAIWVHLDTSNLEDGVMKTREMTYIIVNMLAPSDDAYINTQAVNQYYVQYDAYGLVVGSTPEARYELPSGMTTITLMETIGSISLKKVDGDHEIGTDESGNPKYASLAGAVFQIYDEDYNPLFDSDGVSANALGVIELENLEYGTYYWEELTAPDGYEKIDGLHAFQILSDDGEVVIPNTRKPGEVVLTKKDRDDSSADALAGAVFELYTVSGDQVFFDADGAYSETGTESQIITGADGTLTVTNLPWGSYYFVEITAPDGYELNESNVNFTIGKSQYDDESGKVLAEVTAYDEEKTASILLVKKDASNGGYIKDAVFTLYKVGDTQDTSVKSGLRTNVVGEIQVDDLKFGTYYFKETRNADGYILPDPATTDRVTLDVSTVESTVTITMENERMKGSVELNKADDAGYAVSGAVYDLYYQAEGTTGYSVVGTYTTNDEGDLTATDLDWGDYYFLETSSPKGYDLNTEPITFAVTTENVVSTIYLTTVDNRKKGSVILTKVDAEEKDTVLPGAVYELYFTDGTKCVLDTDYTLPNGETEIVTGTDGTIQISGLAQGSYYLLEVTAPTNYSLSDEKIRFSVTRESSEIVQDLTAKDVKGKAELTIHKEITSVYSWYGNPTFLFKIEQVDPLSGEVVDTYYQAITLSESELTGSVTLTVDQGYDYMVTEVNVSRYTLQEITTNDDNVDINGIENVTAHLSDPYEEAEMTFSNDFKQYEKFSHVSSTVNMVKAAKLLTGITVTYTGDSPLSGDSPNYDSEEEIYTIPNSDVTVVAIYDDGSERVLDPSEFTIDDPTADGNDYSYTGTVSYTEGSTTKTGTFSVDIDLPAPTPRYTVTFELNGGSIVRDGDTTNTAVSTWSYQVKSGTAVTKPENDPTKSGYKFVNWYADEALSTAFDFTDAITADTTIYASWTEYYDVKYAVSIYAIQDEDADGTEMALTFGPASGADYTGYSTSGTAPSGTYYVSHLDSISSRAEYESQLASGGDPCLHWMTWEEIIAQAHSDPTVFQDCLDNGCTHSVAINLSDDDGTAKKIRSTSYNGKMFGDGASLLYSSISSTFRSWNHRYSTYYDTSADRYKYGTNEGGWPDSAIRNMLTGTVTDNMLTITNAGTTIDFANNYQVSEDNSLFSGFPEELKNAIYARAVRSNTVYNDRSNEANVAVTHDKLWLFSTNEYWADASSLSSNYKNPLETADGSGTAFERQITLGVNGYSSTAMAKLYYETGSSFYGWLRSVYGGYDYYVLRVSSGGSYVYGSAYNASIGVSPGFSIR